MTYFLKSGSRYNVSTQAAMDLHDTLPVGTYTVKFDKLSGSFYLEAIESFEIKGKVYGNTQQRATRILNTFQERSGSTGVMLSGEKGSGKTLLAKMISLDAQLLGFPTLVINQPWCGEAFNVFMQMIEQPTVVLFDEFEKVYDNEDQEQMLTLLDGVYPSKKLFIITCNDKWRVNQHMKNRPGRIFYRLDYRGLEKEFIEEYCQDNLNDKSHIETICRIAVLFSSFNFDILKAMVEEMNRYGETPQQVMEVLNAKPEQSDKARYKVGLTINGAEISPQDLNSEQWGGNPLTERIEIMYRTMTPKVGRKRASDDDDLDALFSWEEATFTASDLKQIDPDTGKFHYINPRGEILTFVKVAAPTYDWSAY